MNTIYKYKVENPWGNEAAVTLPSKCKVLDIEFQRDDLFVWALVDTEDTSPTHTCNIKIYGTGWEIKNLEQLTHLKTFHRNDCVWHVFLKH